MSASTTSTMIPLFKCFRRIPVNIPQSGIPAIGNA
jgi:hypothetical protein